MTSVTTSPVEGDNRTKPERVSGELKAELLATGNEWLKVGASPLPLELGLKKPRGVWKQWVDGDGHSKSAYEKLEADLSSDKSDGVILALGKNSSNLVCVEWEGKAEKKLGDVLTKLKESLVQKGKSQLVRKIIDEGHLERTPSGGVHLFLFVKGEAPRGKVLARTKDGKVLAELRGQGHALVTAPTPARAEHLKAGLTQGYERIIGSPRTTPRVEPHALETIGSALTELLDEYEKPTTNTPTPEPLSREVLPVKSGETEVDKFSRVISWSELLDRYRFTFVSDDGKHRHYSRPDEPNKGDIAVGISGGEWGGTLWVFHTGLGALEADKSYTKQGFIAAVEFRGQSPEQFRSAARFMAEWIKDREPQETSLGEYEDVLPPTHLDLAWVARGEKPEQVKASSLARNGGSFGGYRGKRINMLYGDPESGKSWVLYSEQQAELKNGGRALFLNLDFEDTSETVSRLLGLGTDRLHIGDSSRFRLYQPETTEALRRVLDEAKEFDPTLVVIDSLGGMLTMLGLDSLKDGDVREGWTKYVRPFGDISEACAVWVIDHLTKKQVQGRNTDSPYGSTAKKQLVRGVMLRAEVKEELAPERVGRVNLYVEKDNSGKVRQVSKDKLFGSFVLDSTDPEAIVVEIADPSEVSEKAEKLRPTNLMEKVATHLAVHGTCSMHNITTNVTGRKGWVEKAVHQLVKEEYVEEWEAGKLDGRGGGKRYRRKRPYFEALDPLDEYGEPKETASPSNSNLVPTSSELSSGEERTSELSNPPIGVRSSQVQGKEEEAEMFSPEWSQPLPPLGGAA